MNKTIKKLFFILFLLFLVLFFTLFDGHIFHAIKEMQMEEVIVTKIVDGDTIVIEGGQRVRLLGIDSPEKGEAFYKESKKFLEDLMLYKKVQLEKDMINKDKYNRLLRWIWFNDTLVNAEIVRNGLAIAKFYESSKYQKTIAKAEKEAMENKIGIWNYSIQK